MKKSELKKVLKPLIKECIQEAILEEGLLSTVISEVVKGLGTTQQLVVEQKQENDNEIRQLQLQEKQKRIHKMSETRKKMLDAIGRDSYNGVDLFENTAPLTRAGNPAASGAPQGALSGLEPTDAGVDISRFAGKANIWKALAKG